MNSDASIEGHRLRRPCGIGAVVLVAEADVAVVHVEQPLVGDRHAVPVAADVFEDLWRTGEGPFGVHDPVRVPRGCEMRGKARRISEDVERARDVELTVVERLL